VKELSFGKIKSYRNRRKRVWNTDKVGNAVDKEVRREYKRRLEELDRYQQEEEDVDA